MKTRVLFSLFLVLFVSSLAAPTHGQEPVTTGTVIGVNKEKGTITIRRIEAPTQTLTYYGMDKANLQTGNGQVATIDSVTPGMLATVAYTQRGKRLYVSRVQVQPPRPGTPAAEASATTSNLKPPPPTNASGATSTTTTPVIGAPPAAVRSRAATDGDITTQPGSKAAIDNDITTQPGSKAATDGDITTQPGSKAATDGDITTQPGSKAATDGDITTQPGSKAATDGDITTQPGKKAATDGDITTQPASESTPLPRSRNR